MTLQQRVEQLCKQHGGLRKAARATGLDASYLYRLSCGEKQRPTYATLRKLGLTMIVTYRKSRP